MNHTSRTAKVALFCFVALVHHAAHAQSAGSRLMGVWTGVHIGKGENPQASGIEVELWTNQGQLSGYMVEYVGPDADPPVGKLDGIRFDEKTGSLAFTAKLSVGVVAAARGSAWIPSKNVYEFKGTLGKDAMTGTLRRKFVDEDGGETAYDENVTLESKKLADAAAAESFADWTKRWSEALKKRGPKW